ncbi:unnamed protein product [Discula destructiva]
MYFLTILAFLGLAAAAPVLPPRQAATTQLTFTGAAASVPFTAPVDGSTFQLPAPVSVDFIAQAGGATCAFNGVDGAQLTVLGANSGATLAPPQVVVAGSCR